MLSFIRRIINSKAGVVITLGLLGVIAIMFGLNGNLSGLGGGGPATDSIATVGKEQISAAELRKLVENQFASARQQQPTLTMAQFVAGGGVDGTVERMINGSALTQFAQQQRLIASKQLVDGQIASIPEFQGVDGKFSQTVYDQVLATNHLTDKQLHDDIAQRIYARYLLVPTQRDDLPVPAGIAQPYASLLLEKRDGEIGIIPTQAMGQGAAPTDAELTGFYKRNISRYTVPERRSMRYALVTPDLIKASTTPSDAELAQAYQAQRAKFAPAEKRKLVQVVIADQAAATALAAKVKAGTPIEAAARAAGLEPNALDVDKAGYVAQSSADIANAAFAAPKGTVLGPLRGALGFIVVRVEGIEQIAGKSLEQARPELVKTLTAQKTLVAMSDLHDKIDDGVANRRTFDELVRTYKLDAKASPPLFATGINPDDPASKADPAFAQVITAGFAAEEGDDPQVVPYGPDGFAVVSLAKITKAAPRSAAEIHDVLVRDFQIDRAERAARQVAVDVVARVNKGMPLAQSLAATKLKLPASKTIPPLSRQQIAQQRQAPPPLVLMFSMAEKHAKLLELPNKAGWYVIYLNHIERGDATGQPDLVKETRGMLSKALGNEYAQQFTEALRRALGVKKNAKAIADVKAALTGQGGSN